MLKLEYFHFRRQGMDHTFCNGAPSQVPGITIRKYLGLKLPLYIQYVHGDPSVSSPFEKSKKDKP